jgi:hypothetical protein
MHTGAGGIIVLFISSIIYRHALGVKLISITVTRLITSSIIINNIVTRIVTVDGVLDRQLDLLDNTQLHTITMYTLQLTRLDS